MPAFTEKKSGSPCLIAIGGEWSIDNELLCSSFALAEALPSVECQFSASSITEIPAKSKIAGLPEIPLLVQQAPGVDQPGNYLRALGRNALNAALPDDMGTA
tara:strand:+ start:183 stop:488 length:306 start_codon:yes stop_codon:yes gene_type:complete